MADLINISTKQVVISANDVLPEYQTGYMQIAHSLALSLKQVPSKYIVIYNGIAREMTSQEKAEYDASQPAAKIFKSKMQILNEIWATFYPPSGATPDETIDRYDREQRMMGAINANPVWLVFLEDASYNTARGYMQGVLATGSITSGDYAIIDGILPSGQYN
jgi:hypothetical protein